MSEERDKRLEDVCRRNDPGFMRLEDVRSLLADYRAAVRLLACSGKWAYERGACEGCGNPSELHALHSRAERAEAENEALRAERDKYFDLAASMERMGNAYREQSEEHCAARDRLREAMVEARAKACEAAGALCEFGGAEGDCTCKPCQHTLRVFETLRRALAGESRAEEPGR